VSGSAALRRWLATADAVPARLARSSLRAMRRASARARSGSVAAEMDRIVAEAGDDTVGYGLAASVRRRALASRLRDRRRGPGGEPAARTGS
jgi:hypothetical protein